MTPYEASVCVDGIRHVIKIVASPATAHWGEELLEVLERERPGGQLAAGEWDFGIADSEAGDCRGGSFRWRVPDLPPGVVLAYWGAGDFRRQIGDLLPWFSAYPLREFVTWPKWWNETVLYREDEAPGLGPRFVREQLEPYETRVTSWGVWADHSVWDSRSRIILSSGVLPRQPGRMPDPPLTLVEQCRREYEQRRARG